MLIMASLQLQPGVFALFYHYASGKFSKARTSDITLFFILGVETSTALLFLSVFYVSNALFLYQFRPETGFFTWIIIGILIALTFISSIFYYRSGPGTRLFISRKCADNLNTHARTAKTRSDAFTLGALSSICELPFTLPLYIITSIEITETSILTFPSYLLILFYILVPTIPLFIIRWRFQTGYNLANIERSRIKNKNFTRLILSFSYFAIAALLIYFRIIA